MKGKDREPWYRNPPPEWYRKIGRYGVWPALLLSITALIVALRVMTGS